MVDVVSIVLAVISLAGALGATIIAGWFSLYSDNRKRLTESEKLVVKYRDPLMLAAGDLQSRLYNIVDQDILSYFEGGKAHQEILVVYTCFLVGQYFAWTNILRRQAQFLCFATDRENKSLNEALAAIKRIFASDLRHGANQPPLLWRGQQSAMGELMTITEGSELMCMGYAAFTKKWDEPDFRRWFEPVRAGMELLAQKKKASPTADVDNRLRHLQHLIQDLIAVLDPKQLRSGNSDSRRCRPCPGCDCLQCKPKRLTSANRSQRSTGRGQV